MAEVDLAPHGGRPAQLALPARPPHRRLRRHRPALPRLSAARAGGFRMPAEWEPHEATWLAWPHNALGLARQVRAHPLGLREIVRKLAPGERVRILVHVRRATRPGARRMLHAGRRGPGAGRVLPLPHRPRLDARLGPDLRAAATGRRRRSPSPASASTPGPSTPTGSRTTGCRSGRRARCGLPLRPVGAQRPAGGAGGRQHRRERARHAAHHRGVPARPRRPGAQPGLLARATTRRVLRERAGRHATCSGWAAASPATTPTGTSTTSAASWTRARVVLCARERSGRRQLPAAGGEPRAPAGRCGWRTASRPEVVALPMPAPLVFDGRRLPASYANFYIANAAVLVPTFNDPGRPRGAGHPLPSCSPTGRWSASTRSTWSGAWARCTA